MARTRHRRRQRGGSPCDDQVVRAAAGCQIKDGVYAMDDTVCQSKVYNFCKKNGDLFEGCNGFELPLEDYEPERTEDPFSRNQWKPMMKTRALTGRHNGGRRKTSRRKTSSRRKSSKRKQY